MNDLRNVPERDPSAKPDEGRDAEEGAEDVLDDVSEAQAHCPHCLEPVEPEQYYCPKCNQAISGLVGVLPYVNIPFQVNFFGAAWRRMLAEGISFPMRALCALIILLYAPIMFLGVPFILWHKLFFRRAPQQRA